MIQFAKPINTFGLTLNTLIEVRQGPRVRRFNLFGISYRRLAMKNIVCFMFADAAGHTYQGINWGDGKLDFIRKVDYNHNPKFL